MDSTIIPDIKHPDWKYTNLKGRVEGFSSTPDLAPVETWGLKNGVELKAVSDIEISENGVFQINLDAAAPGDMHISIKQGVQAVLAIRLTGNASPEWFKQISFHIRVAPSARLKMYRVQHGSAYPTTWERFIVQQQANSFFSFWQLALSPAYIRNDFEIHMNESGSESMIGGVQLLDGNSHVDNTVSVFHHAPHCESNQLIRNVVTDTATAVFSGKIFVDRDAQKTNAYQSNKNLLLSPTANAYARPQLEIYADDVKCSHGSTTGQMNNDALFYLRARGISEDKARHLLLGAFVADVLEHITDLEIREEWNEILAHHLGK